MKGLIQSIWGKCNGSQIRQSLLIASVIATLSLIVCLLIFLPVARGIFAIVVIVLLFRLGGKTNEINMFDYQKAYRVATLMTELLTLLYIEIGIRKPYDVYSVWMNPTINGEVWTYHAKARQSDNVQLDPDSLDEYIALINGRAIDISAPIRVTKIHPRGNTFVYDVFVTEAVKFYLTPQEIEKLDKDF